MKIVFSRKGFDSASGGGPSPIVKGRAMSLPIPDSCGVSRTTYGNLGLGGHAKRASRGRLAGRHHCHNDPMFLEDGRAMLGQCGAAQTHLERQGVGPGDLFVFFGLFRDGSEPPHHRIFGYLQADETIAMTDAAEGRHAELAKLGHPHALGMHASNDVVWCGRGRTGAPASDFLRLTAPGALPSLWKVPAWLFETGLSYHGKPERWLPDNRLQSVPRGQEFVADIGDRRDAQDWAARIIAEIES